MIERKIDTSITGIVRRVLLDGIIMGYGCKLTWEKLDLVSEAIEHDLVQNGYVKMDTDTQVVVDKEHLAYLQEYHDNSC